MISQLELTHTARPAARPDCPECFSNSQPVPEPSPQKIPCNLKPVRSHAPVVTIILGAATISGGFPSTVLVFPGVIGRCQHSSFRSF